MPLCSHCFLVTPLFPALAPRIYSPSNLFLSPHGQFLRSRLSNLEVGIFSNPRRLGLRVRVFCGNRAGNNAPVDRCVKKRKIVEHIILLQAKVDLSDAHEKDMIDFMYTSQYYMSGIIAISIGRIEDPNIDNITHAVYMRFQKKEDAAKFSADPRFLEVIKEHVFPYCYVCPATWIIFCGF